LRASRFAFIEADLNAAVQLDALQPGQDEQSSFDAAYKVVGSGPRRTKNVLSLWRRWKDGIQLPKGDLTFHGPVRLRMQERVTPAVMRMRRSTVEHPFATIKYCIFGHPVC
jgi:hypothetical protein